MLVCLSTGLIGCSARSLGAARKEIQDWAGRQFDPEVVEVFLQMSDDVFEELRRAIGGHVDPLAYSAGGYKRFILWGINTQLSGSTSNH